MVILLSVQRMKILRGFEGNDPSVSELPAAEHNFFPHDIMRGLPKQGPNNYWRGVPMSYKFDSMMIILNKIDSGEKVTVQSLKEDLGVSERTVHRYLETLQLGGYPLYFDRPRERYSFPDGYSMKKPGFTSGEALAFALAKKLT
jgi:hypothetical protein